MGMRVDDDPPRKLSVETGSEPPKAIPLKDRTSMVFVERARIDVRDGTCVAIDAEGQYTQLPIGGIACLMLEPGARISHAAVSLAAQAGTLVTWVGEAGVRLYSAGQPGGARADKLLWQAQLALDETARLRVVRKMFEIRFGETPPDKRSVDQLRGIEGHRVRHSYELLAKQYRVEWKGRSYNPHAWDTSDVPNKCLSAATSCLHGLCEAAVLAAGYAPAIGFLHRGKPRSFVYDVADLWKLQTVVPQAFKIAGKIQAGKLHDAPERAVRHACRDAFRASGLLQKIIPQIEEVLSAGDLPKPDEAPEAMPTAFQDEKGHGDDGHRR